MLAFALTCDGATYLIDPPLATLSTLSKRALPETGAAVSIRFATADPIPAGDEPSFLSLGVMEPFLRSSVEPGEKTKDPSDPSES